MLELVKNLKFAWRYVKGQKTKLILFAITNVIMAVIGVVLPVLSAKMVVNLTSNELSQLIYISIIIFIIEMIQNIIKFSNDYFIQVIYRETFTNTQKALGTEILKLQNKTLDKNSSGVFIQRLISDTGRLSSIFNNLTINLSNIISNIGILVAVLIINVWAFLFLIFMLFVLIIVRIKESRVYNEKDKEFRKEEEKVSGFTGEVVRGARDIKMLNAENSFLRVMNEKIIMLNQKRYKMMRVIRNYDLLGRSLIDFMDLVFIILLVYLLVQKNLTIPLALVIYNYSGETTSIIFSLDNLFRVVKDFNLSAKRIFDITLDKEFPKESFGNKHLSKIDGNFEFKDVNFSYGDNKVLDNLSFKIDANSTVAFVGKSGAGKSTIFSLIDKMYEVDSGEILIDGVNINELDKDSIRNNITVINQNPYIFNLSIKDNLKLVKENLTDEEMINACKMACLDEFINTLPDKYDTVVGEGGITLSGGQKQRLAIARALIQKTEIILFDEATSALDNETQKEIQEAIHNMQGEYTILIIAHRLSTIIDSDRILFLNDGHIEAEGTHEELLNKSLAYKHLYETELKTNTNN